MCKACQVLLKRTRTAAQHVRFRHLAGNFTGWDTGFNLLPLASTLGFRKVGNLVCLTSKSKIRSHFGSSSWRVSRATLESFPLCLCFQVSLRCHGLCLLVADGITFAVGGASPGLLGSSIPHTSWNLHLLWGSIPHASWKWTRRVLRKGGTVAPTDNLTVDSPLWLARHDLCRCWSPEVRILFKMVWQRFVVWFPLVGNKRFWEGGVFTCFYMFLPLHRPWGSVVCSTLIVLQISTGEELFALGVLSVWDLLRPPVFSRFFYGPAPALAILASRVVSVVSFAKCAIHVLAAYSCLVLDPSRQVQLSFGLRCPIRVFEASSLSTFACLWRSWQDIGGPASRQVWEQPRSCNWFETNYVLHSLHFHDINEIYATICYNCAGYKPFRSIY